MIAAVKKGDKVVTAGGVHALVYTVKEKTVILKVDENTKMEFSKSAIAGRRAQGRRGEGRGPRPKRRREARRGKK